MNLLAFPVLIPLFAAILLLIEQHPQRRRLLAILASTLTLLVNTLVATRTISGEVLSVQMGGWSAPFGITLVADGLTGLMLLLAGLTGLLTVLYATTSLQHPPGRGASSALNLARERFGALGLLQFLFMGVNMSFVTGDLFNLFVSFEVMLIASYGLLLLGAEAPQLREGFKYVVINLAASAIFVVAAGFAYGLFGTLNMADIALRLRAAESNPGVTLIALLLALVFATKAAVLPFGFWLPTAYPAPPAAISAFFAALLTKVGIYALVRSFTLMFPAETGVQLMLLALAGVSLLLGALGAISRQRWRHLLAFVNIASIGYLALGMFGGSVASLGAGLYYLLHSVLVIFAMFLIAGLAEHIAGPRFRDEGHLAHYPYLGLGFFIGALALTGLPPTSGFIAKFGLLRSLLETGGALRAGLVVTALVTSFLLIYALVTIWRSFFWGESDAVHEVPLPSGMVRVTALAVAIVVMLIPLSGPLYRLSENVAQQLSSNEHYIAQVLSTEYRAQFEAHSLSEDADE